MLYFAHSLILTKISDQTSRYTIILIALSNENNIITSQFAPGLLKVPPASPSSDFDKVDKTQHFSTFLDGRISAGYVEFPDISRRVAFVQLIISRHFLTFPDILQHYFSRYFLT